MNAFEIKNEIFTRLREEIVSEFPECFVTGEYQESIKKFPTITFEEKSNTVYQQSSTDVVENAANLMYEVNVYTNTIGYREDDAREYMLFINNFMASLGFTRTMLSPIPNLADSTIYRLTARYTGVAFFESEETAELNAMYRIYQN